MQNILNTPSAQLSQKKNCEHQQQKCIKRVTSQNPRQGPHNNVVAFQHMNLHVGGRTTAVGMLGDKIELSEIN